MYIFLKHMSPRYEKKYFLVYSSCIPHIFSFGSWPRLNTQSYRIVAMEMLFPQFRLGDMYEFFMHDLITDSPLLALCLHVTAKGIVAPLSPSGDVVVVADRECRLLLCIFSRKSFFRLVADHSRFVKAELVKLHSRALTITFSRGVDIYFSILKGLHFFTRRTITR